MILDELALSIRTSSSDPLAIKLADLLSQWKDDDSNVEDLESRVERYIGNSWISSEEEQKQIYRLWSEFKSDTVKSVRGMTMNERLFRFGLMDRFDTARTEQKRMTIYVKLLASP